MEEIDITKLSPEALNKLQKQIEERNKKEEERIQSERETYKKLRDEAIVKHFKGYRSA